MAPTCRRAHPPTRRRASLSRSRSPPCSPPFLPLAPPQEIPENPEIPEIMESVLFSYRCHHRDNRRHRDGRESGQRRFSEQTLVLEVRHDGEGDDNAVLATKIPSAFPLIQLRPGPRTSPPSGSTCLVNNRMLPARPTKIALATKAAKFFRAIRRCRVAMTPRAPERLHEVLAFPGRLGGGVHPFAAVLSIPFHLLVAQPCVRMPVAFACLP